MITPRTESNQNPKSSKIRILKVPTSGKFNFYLKINLSCEKSNVIRIITNRKNYIIVRIRTKSTHRADKTVTLMYKVYILIS